MGWHSMDMKTLQMYFVWPSAVEMPSACHPGAGKKRLSVHIGSCSQRSRRLSFPGIRNTGIHDTLGDIEVLSTVSRCKGVCESASSTPQRWINRQSQRLGAQTCSSLPEAPTLTLHLPRPSSPAAVSWMQSVCRDTFARSWSVQEGAGQQPGPAFQPDRSQGRSYGRRSQDLGRPKYRSSRKSPSAMFCLLFSRTSVSLARPILRPTALPGFFFTLVNS